MARMLALAPLLAACAVPQITQQQYLHSLTIEENGNPLEVVVERGDRLPHPPDNTIATQLANIATRREFADAKQVLIFVHGGLNSLEDGLARTGAIAECILEDSNGEVYPLFVNWNSSLGNSYLDHLLHYRQGKRVNDFWGAVSSPFILLADFGRALTRAPIVFWYQGYAGVERTFRTASARRVPLGWEAQAIAVDRYKVSAADKWADGAMRVFPGVLRIVTTLAVDTTGFTGYDMIQRRIDTLFRTEDDLSARTMAPSGAVTELMAKIPPDKPIVLIGHSMGTIVLNELIRRFPDHNYTEIVYLGAACTIRDFADTVPAYLRRHPHARFFDLCLHPAADENEVSLWSVVPNGSLLEWLDAYVLGPRTLLDRTMGKWNNVAACLNLLGDLPQGVRERIFVKGFPVEGTDFPYSHGSFDAYAFWREAFWNPKQQAPVPTIEAVHSGHRGVP